MHRDQYCVYSLVKRSGEYVLTSFVFLLLNKYYITLSQGNQVNIINTS